jgi:prepilin-type N-terminal cleavage/methylation domain-containing protein
MDLWQKGSFMKQCAYSQQGLTLIELMIALLLLAGAFTVLLGLQGSVLGRTFEDGRRLQAMLIARQILSAVESSDTALENQSKTGSVRDILEEVGTVDSEDDQRLASLAVFEVTLEVTDVQLPQIEGNLMKHLLLTVSWGEKANNAFLVDYFFPAEVAEDDAQGGADNA